MSEALMTFKVKLNSSSIQELTRKMCDAISDVGGTATYIEVESVKLEGATAAMTRPAASPTDRLVTWTISIGRDLAVYNDTQTHGNTFAEVYRGFFAIKKELNRQIAARRSCPYNPVNPQPPIFNDDSESPLTPTDDEMVEMMANTICERRNAPDWPCNGLDFDMEMARVALARIRPLLEARGIETAIIEADRVNQLHGSAGEVAANLRAELARWYAESGK